MLNTTILERYAIKKQARENDLFTEYWGEDTKMGRDVTAAAIRPVPAADFFARFNPLNKKMMSVHSRHVPDLVELDEVNGQAVIIRNRVEGQALREMLAAGNLPLELVLGVAQQLGEYLDLLHQSGLTQLVFELEDTWVSAGNPAQVTNFGIAQGLNLGGLLAANKIPARPSYAPELLKGAADARADFYSLGALLFQALTGKELNANYAAADKTLVEDFFPSRLRMGISTEWDVLVARCLHPNPAKRIQSAAEFLNQVDEISRSMNTLAANTPLSMEDSLVGQTLGSYRLVSRLGQGGMATVYKAYEPALDRYVAIKVLPQFFAKDPVFVQRFRREAKAVAQLNHPNIVPIYSYGETNGVTYIAMQFVMGDTLKHDGQKFTFDESLRLLAPIARALGYAHQRGVVHRDVKPSNILITEDGNWPLLADFGLAQMAQASGKLTESGVGMGTPMYMSPEQGQGEKVDQRTDIYSLGIVLYELITGDVPFRADTPMAIVIKHINAPMPMPRQVNPHIPDYLEAVILKATAKNPDHRYQTAEEMANAMEDVLARLLTSPPAARTPLSLAATLPNQAFAQPAATPPPPESNLEAKQKARPAASQKTLRAVMFSIAGIIGVICLGVALMGIFDICPPPGPWSQPPWCAESPYQLPTIDGGETSTPAPVVTDSAPGKILFQDDFEGSVSPHWMFVCDPNTSPWIAEEIDGRTVFHSQPPKPPGKSSCAEFRDTGWQEYAIQFNFKFLKPNLGAYSFSIAGRATNCSPPIAGVQQYVSVVSNDGVFLHKGTCKPDVTQLAEKRRYIAPDAWHTFQYIFNKNRVQLLIDGEALIDFVDEKGPILEGGDMWFVTEGDAEILVDDLKVYEIVPAAAAAAPAQTNVMLDDFENESPAGRSDWESYFEDNKDTKLDCYVEDSRGLRDSNYLNFDFDVAENSWATCGIYFDATQDWSAAQGIVFYLRSDQANAPYEVNVFGGTPDAHTTYLYSTVTQPESVDGWARVEIPWSEFLGVSWEANYGKPIDPAAVTGFAVGFSTPEKKRESGALWLDDLQLLSTASAAQTEPPVIFFDDFERLERSDLESYFLEGGDTKTACSLDKTIAHESAASLKFSFDIAPDAWASCGSSFNDVKDWSAGQGIAFYVHATQADLWYEVNLFGGPLGADETYLHELATTPESVNGWVRVEVYWKDILRADWEDHAGTPVNPASIIGFSFDTSAPQQSRLTGALWIDDFQVIP